MKINIGCGEFPLEGFTNIDLYEPADILGDFRTMEFENVTEITMFHVLEHLSWREGPAVIRHVRKWLAPGGRLTVEVPDMQKIMERGTYQPDWIYWVYGVQIHPGEYHLAGYTMESLYELVSGNGFDITDYQRFLSEHPARPGFPCLIVSAVRT